MEVIGERGESGSVTTPHLNETLLVLAMSGEEGQGAGGGGDRQDICGILVQPDEVNKLHVEGVMEGNDRSAWKANCCVFMVTLCMQGRGSEKAGRW